MKSAKVQSEAGEVRKELGVPGFSELRELLVAHYAQLGEIVDGAA